GFALLLILGSMVWEGAAEHIVPAALIGIVAVSIATIAPGAAVAGVLAAAPTMYELHPLPRGEFSLLELAILVLVGGVGLHMCWSLVRRDAGPWRALVTPVQITVPVVLI